MTILLILMKILLSVLYDRVNRVNSHFVLFMHAHGSAGTAANMQLTLVTNVLVKARQVF